TSDQRPSRRATSMSTDRGVVERSRSREPYEHRVIQKPRPNGAVEFFYGVVAESDRIGQHERMETPRAWMSWSSGKDSAFALHVARVEQCVDVRGLLVTVNADADRVAMHAVRRTLLEAQAERLGLPLHVVEIPSPCPNDVYQARMAAAMTSARTAGVEAMVLGDLFLQDVRAYRERNLAA